MSDELLKTSISQGGRGVALRQKSNVSVLAVPQVLGQSPGPGTGCTVFLNTLSDHAYDGAQVDFIAMFFGRTVIFETQFIDPLVNASQPSIELTAYGCAADYWQVQLTLLSGSTPAVQLQSSIVAFGVENISAASAASAPPGIQRLLYSSSPQQVTIATPGIKQYVLIIGFSGAGTFKMPTGCVNGQEVEFLDGDGYFAINTPTFTTTGGVTMADPQNSGTFGTTVQPVAQAGNPASFVYGATDNKWFNA